MQPLNIVWFRRDLRLSDNEIVSLAAANKAPTIFVFTIDPWFFKQAEIGAMRVQFLIESLVELDINLQRLGSRLHILSGESSACIKQLLTACRANKLMPKLFFNQDIQVAYGLQRDAAIQTFCSENNIFLHIGQAYFLLHDKRQMDHWYDEYYAYQSAPQWHLPLHFQPYTADWLLRIDQIKPAQLAEWAGQYIPALQASPLFIGGETQAQRSLQTFLTNRYHGYHWKLSRPHLARQGATSQLSPHLAFGTISPRQVNAAAYRMKQRLKHDAPNDVKTLTAFLSRVRWRDSFTQRLLFFPELIWKNRFAEFDEIYQDQSLHAEQRNLFQAWQSGQTGFPLLDASMRELAADGWLNFRMRAQAVTMLCIVFGVSWHHGARYFMQQLVDGDVAINHWQWQMQAGITNPLSPIFRIYNPSKNLRERDPDLQYIHRWLPEYRDCRTVDQVLKRAQPMVDFNSYKKLHADNVSRLRRTVRQRILQQGGAELTEAAAMHRVTQNNDVNKSPVT